MPPDPEHPGNIPAVGRNLGILDQIELRIERYLWIKTLMSLLTAALSWVVLALIGCQNASFWALIVFMINYIPFLGSVIGVLFPALLVLVQFGSFGPFLAAVVGLVTAVSLDRKDTIRPLKARAARSA